MQSSCDSWTFEEDRFILCEGRHDKHFLQALLKEQDLPSFQVRHAAECNDEDQGGVDGFGLTLATLVAMTGFKNLKGIAIVTDNDDGNALRDVKRKIKKYANRNRQYEYKTTKSDYIIVIQGIPVRNSPHSRQ